ncbi:MAG: phosphoadenylyl-sulfate reductase [Firmicutes bacterium]|nr:phosphoadenylyl-sulfate reductase [Alicyclobacillaceae bacterium]MCL6498059.1 phosphoadenylyl-sulfate reductase [Bacillota bacterium]
MEREALTALWKAFQEILAWQDPDPRDILAFVYAHAAPNTVTLASSFGLEDVLLLHWAAAITPCPDVFCLDTGLLFPETYALIETLKARYRFRLRRIAPSLTLAQQRATFGPELWRRDPDACCRLRKVEPLGRALEGYAVWITGIRREQTPARRHAQWVEADAATGRIKVNPLAHWTGARVRQAVEALGVPYNPLHDQGYPSLGCWPCTRPVRPGEDPRAGRWPGFAKTECGIHQ